MDAFTDLGLCKLCIYFGLKKPLPISGISQGWKLSKNSVVHGHVVPTVCFCFSYDSKTTK